ncbi:MAG: type II toxin-antitoxin system HicB family antitoxin [Nostoc sp.]|uniref:type II toxin-antitoxin system HicB family antitoxin n=1 Tax=Nostoc sp. TaxID=1180 RepID=UPI002FF9AAED
MKFQVFFTPDLQHTNFVAEVPELPGCVSQGKTLDEAIDNIEDAIRGYLHVQAKHENPHLDNWNETQPIEIIINLKSLETFDTWEDTCSEEEIIDDIYSE